MLALLEPQSGLTADLGAVRIVLTEAASVVLPFQAALRVVVGGTSTAAVGFRERVAGADGTGIAVERGVRAGLEDDIVLGRAWSGERGRM